MQDNWLVVPEAIAIGRRAFRTIKQNLWFTAGYNVVGMLLAATGWLPPVAAAAAQSLPDVAVMLNASRLLRHRNTPASKGREDPTGASVPAAAGREQDRSLITVFSMLATRSIRPTVAP